MDELSPLFRDIEFHERFRGYDQDEVDAYIDRLATAAAVVQGRMTELQDRIDAAEARLGEDGAGHETEETLARTLVLAQRTADAAVAEAREDAERLTAEAEREADATLTGARAEAQITLREAQTEAAAILRAAEEQAAALLGNAEEQQRQLVAEAESVAAEAAVVARERLALEVAELQDCRAFLADDVEILERHLGEQRDQIAASLSTLTDLIESPEIFRTTQAPATSGVEFTSDLLDVADDVDGDDVDGDDVDGDDVDVAPMVLAEPESEMAESEMVESEMAESEMVESEMVESEMAEPAAFVSQYPAPTPFDDADDADDADDTDDADAGDVLRSREEFEPVGATEQAVSDDAELVDLTDGTAPSPTIDLDPSGDPEPIGGVSEGSAPAPSRLVTAADLDPSSSVVTAPAESFDDPGPSTAQMPLVEEASLFADPTPAGEDSFLAQLREAVAGDDAEGDGDDDALNAFFDQEPEEEGRSWFGRRR